MPAPYSQDLRRRVINAYYNKEGSQRQIAKRFQVSLTFVRNLLRHYRQTGTIEPKKHGGGTKTKIDNHGFAVIEQMIQQKPDLIFSELCQLLKEKTGVKVSKSSMYRYVQKLNMSRKKSLSASEQHREDIKQQRYQYRRWLDFVDINNERLCR